MSDFNLRADSVNVEQIMEQIRARIREKRGVDYTEAQIHELATVKLEKFLDSRGVRSDLLEEFRRVRPPYQPPDLPNFSFEEQTLFESHRGPLRWIRRLLRPILKLFFNPNPLIAALHIQSKLNAMGAEREARREAARHGIDQLHYELLHNLVVETTRIGIDVRNLQMRAESLASRLEFNERRARALESVVVYQPAETPEEAPPGPDGPQRVEPPAEAAAGRPQEGPGQRSRRRRRRRGRHGGAPASAVMGGQAPREDAAPIKVEHVDIDSASRNAREPSASDDRSPTPAAPTGLADGGPRPSSTPEQ